MQGTTEVLVDVLSDPVVRCPCLFRGRQTCQDSVNEQEAIMNVCTKRIYTALQIQ
jgi:hypothetical protein